MENKFIIRIFHGEINEICYLKTKSGLSTKLIQDAFEFNSLQQASLVISKLNLVDDGHTDCDILLKNEVGIWQRV